MAGDRKNDDLQWLEQVGALGDARQPLVAGLRALADDLYPGPLKKRLLLLVQRLEAGMPLEEALKASAEFPDYLRSAIAIGLRTGQLGSVVQELAWQQQANRTRLRGVSTALLYPMLVLAVLIAVTQLLAAWLVPAFVDVYNDFQMDLPAATAWTISVARWGLPWISFSGVLMLLVLVVLQLRAPGWFSGYWLHRLPLFGPLWCWTSFAEVSRMLAILVRYEVPLPEALRLAADGVHDRSIAAGCRSVAAGVEAGQPLSVAVRRERFFPASLAPLIDWGEKTRSLASSLEMASDIYSDRVELQATFIRTVLPPILLIIVMLVVSLSIVCLTVPLIDLIQGLT